MAKPANTPVPTPDQIAAIEAPKTQKKFSLAQAIDRYIPRGTELEKGKTKKATEVVLWPLKWGNILDLPLDVSRLDHGDLLDVAASTAKEHPRTMDELSMSDAAPILDYVARGLIPLSQKLMGGDGAEEPDEIHDGSAAVMIKIQTEGFSVANEIVPEIVIPCLKAAHVRGYPLDAGSMTFRDAREMVGKATGYTDGALDKLELADVGNLIEALLGFLLGLRAI